MLGHLLDEQAQNNRLSHVHPAPKILVGIGSLILILIAPSPCIGVLSAGVLSFVILLVAQIPPRCYIRILMIPTGFTLMSVIVILLMTGGGEVYWQMHLLSWLELTITSRGIEECIIILSRVLGCTTSLLFISLTTPLPDIILVLQRFRVPGEITDLMMILYRYIFILLDQAMQIHTAQTMRLGYSRPREATESFGMLCGALFLSSWKSGDNLIQAMECRCYNGSFPTLSPHDPLKASSLLPALIFLTFLACALLLVPPWPVPGVI
ncbi:MAG TPA: cobalt ECF transporter T component CbiQ [Methanospirillum sp.]|nr:cobalt ECF transporter T component CbiQ [Methanospirillum sp.]